jgi:hypothetical protein
MPSFVRVGAHTGPKVKHTARGWQARRIGSKVEIFWGPIDVLQLGLGKTKYVWLRTKKLPRRKVYRCASVAAARRKYTSLRIRKMRRAQGHDGYSPLPNGIRIRRRGLQRKH